MNIIKRYVHDVTRRLPERQRRDVAEELTAEIEDMVEDRAKGKRPTKQHAYDVLMELGDPSVFADQYRDRPRYLIGPDNFEPYIVLLKTIYLIVLPILIFILWMTDALATNQSAWDIILKIAGVTLEASVHIFFWTTLSFIVVEKIAGARVRGKDWTPNDLPNTPPSQEITRSESYFAIAWSVFAVLATLYQVPAIFQWLAPDDVPQFFAPGMWPAWTLGLLGISLLGLAVEIAKLAVGGWTKLTVALIWIVNSLSVAFFVSVTALVYPIANPDLLKLIAESLGKPDITQSVHTGIIVFVIIVVLVNLWEMAESVYKYKKGGK